MSKQSSRHQEDLVKVNPAGLWRPLLLLDPGQWLSVLWRLAPPATTSPSSSRPRAMPFGLVKVASAGLRRVVASVFSAPGSGSPSPVEVAPAGLCRVVFFFRRPLSRASPPCSRLVLTSYDFTNFFLKIYISFDTTLTHLNFTSFVDEFNSL